MVPFFVAVSALGSYPAARGYGSVLMSKIFGGINVNRLLRSNNGSTFEPSRQSYAVVFSFVPLFFFAKKKRAFFMNGKKKVNKPLTNPGFCVK